MVTNFLLRSNTFESLKDFAAALADPINFQSAVEKRTEQLADLLDEDDGEAVILNYNHFVYLLNICIPRTIIYIHVP